MKWNPVVLAVALTFIACSSGRSAEPLSSERHQPKLPELRKELLRMEAEDQKIRAKISNWAASDFDESVVKEMLDVDRRNTARLRGIVDEHGWPGKSLVGEDGAHAAWLIVQHATQDFPFMKRCLRLMEQAASEVSPGDMALLTDRILMRETGKQRYGSQLTAKDGRLVPEPIEDEANVDRRRAEVGLMALTEYVELANKNLAPPPASAPTVK